MRRIRATQPMPKVKLMAVVTLSGVSVEPLLMFPNTPASTDMKQWGRTSMHPAQNGPSPTANNRTMDAVHRYQTNVGQAMQDMTANQSHHQMAIGQSSSLPSIAREQSQVKAPERSSTPDRQPEREQDLER